MQYYNWGINMGMWGNKINRMSLEQVLMVITISTFILFIIVFIEILMKRSRSQKKIKQLEEKYSEIYKTLCDQQEQNKKNQFLIAKVKKGQKDYQERLEKMLEANYQTILEYNLINGEIFYTDGILESLGYNSESILNQQRWNDLIHEEDIDRVINEYNHLLKKKNQHYICQYRIKTSEGSYIWIRENTTAVIGMNGEIIKVIRLFKDINEIKHYEDEIQEILYHDRLTGLPNRHSFQALISEDLKQFLDPSEKRVVITMDIDNFKRINDSLGYQVGDEALMLVAKRLQLLNTPYVSVFKLEGDKFLIYISRISTKEKVELFINKVIETIRKPLQVESCTLHLTCSMGIAVYPDDGVKESQLLKYSDIAIHKAKNEGKNKYTFFDIQYLREIEEMIQVERCLRWALEKEEFILYYQPKVNLDKMQVVGFEALIRWVNVELGFVSPDRFIKEAEATGLIVPIGEWVMREACRFIYQVNQQRNEIITISVNISVVQIMQEGFVSMVLNILDEEHVKPEWLKLEITETVLMTSSKVVYDRLQKLREHGIAIALDDFGKEYSSLSYLKQLPLDILKIDKSFIDDIDIKKSENAIVDIVISLGKKMGFEVIAEGVETQEQLDYLYSRDCKNIQGYIFSKPVPKEDIINIMRNISGL